MDKSEMFRIFDDAKDIIAKLDPSHFTRHQIGWSTLEPVRVVHKVEYFGPDKGATTITLVVAPASPTAHDLCSTIALELVRRGHIGVNVVAEW